MAVSLPVMVTLSVGDEVRMVEGPCVLTDLIIAELSGEAPACAVLMSAGDGMSLITLSVPAGATVIWHGSLAIGAGILATAVLGEVAVTIGWC